MDFYSVFLFHQNNQFKISMKIRKLSIIYMIKTGSNGLGSERIIRTDKLLSVIVT